MKYLKLRTASLEIYASEFHNIASSNDYRFTFAKEMKGKMLISDLSGEYV
jgi:hypothetical protein